MSLSKLTFFSSDRFHLLLSNIGNSMLTPCLNTTTMIIFPTDPVQGELIHVTNRTQVALAFSQKPLLLETTVAQPL